MSIILVTVIVCVSVTSALVSTLLSAAALRLSSDVKAQLIGMQNSTHNIQYIPLEPPDPREAKDLELQKEAMEAAALEDLTEDDFANYLGNNN